jgi:tetratricopeptide (TPR) repeat protein
LGVIIAAPDARCEDEKTRAKKHFQAGIALLEVKNFGGAAREFEASVAIYPGKNSYFNLALCYLILERYEDAIETIEKLKKSFGDELKGGWAREIAAFEKKLKSTIVKLEIGVNVDGATVELDGSEIGKTPLGKPLIIRRGKHEVAVRHVGYEPQKKELDLTEEKEKRLLITLVEIPQEEIEEPVEPAPVEEEPEVVEENPKPKRPWTWISFGLGGATGIAAIVTGSVQLSMTADLKEQCSDQGCDSSLEDEKNKAYNLGIATDVLIAVAATGIALGTILYFVEGKKRSDGSEIAITPSMNPNGAGLVFTHTF